MGIMLTTVVTLQTLLSILSVVRKGSEMSRGMIKIGALCVRGRADIPQRRSATKAVDVTIT